VLRILIEPPLPLDLRALLSDAAAAFPADVSAAAAVQETYAYVMERLPGYYADLDIDADAIESVMAVDASVPSDFDRRVRAVAAFAQHEAAGALAAANKRIANILRKSDAQAGDTSVRENLLQDDAELRLATTVAMARERVAPMLEAGDYAQALSALAELRPVVDRFFDEVMVNVDDPALRANRVALLQGVLSLFSSIADIGRLRPAETA